jgi:hypothetical protein
MICKTCELDKSTDEFYKNPKGKTGYHSSCKECMKNKTQDRRNTKKQTVYKVPNGQGGKWEFDLNLFNQNTPEANYIYGLIAVLGKNNPNVSKRNRDNIMIVSSNKKIIAQISSFLSVPAYELPRAEEHKVKPKHAIMLYKAGMLEQFNKISNLRRDEYRKGKIDGSKWE